MLAPLSASMGALGMASGKPPSFSVDQIAGLTAWLKADALTGLSDGDAVASWPDSSGQSHSASQATSGRRPVYKTNVVNGLPAVRFTAASGHSLSVVNLATALSGQNAHSLFFIMKPSSMTSYPVVLTYPVDVSSWIYIAEYDPSGAIYWGTAAAGVYRLYSASLTTTAWSFLSMVKSSASAEKFWKGGNEITNYGFTGTDGIGATPTMSGDMQLGSYATQSFGMQGDIAEVLAYTAALSDVDRQKVEGYLAHKYALTSQLPSGHPYKSVPPT